MVEVSDIKVETLTNLLPNGLLEIVMLQNNRIVNVKYININSLAKYLETNYREAVSSAS